MSYQDPGARVSTCPDCGHYPHGHGQHGCLVIVRDAQGQRLCCNCLRTRESFIAKAFEACWRE